MSFKKTLQPNIITMASKHVSEYVVFYYSDSQLLQAHKTLGVTYQKNEALTKKNIVCKLCILLH